MWNCLNHHEKHINLEKTGGRVVYHCEYDENSLPESINFVDIKLIHINKLRSIKNVTSPQVYTTAV